MTKQPAYRGEYPGTVTNPEGTKLRVPNGFSWGYEGTGPFVCQSAREMSRLSAREMSRGSGQGARLS